MINDSLYIFAIENKGFYNGVGFGCQKVASSF